MGRGGKGGALGGAAGGGVGGAVEEVGEEVERGGGGVGDRGEGGS